MLSTRLVETAWKATPYAQAWKCNAEQAERDEAYILARDVFYAGAIEMMGLLTEASRERDAAKRLAIELEVAKYVIDKVDSLD